jgi:hypothetical protein
VDPEVQRAIGDDVSIFAMRPSVENDRPVIDFDDPGNRAVDWAALDAALRDAVGAPAPTVNLVVHAADATAWDCYGVPGTLGLFSTRAVATIGPGAMRLLEPVPAALNGSAYVFLRPVQPLPCFDLERSEVVNFRSSPGRIKDITRYAFVKAMIADPLVFTIPEAPGLFATDGVRTALVGSGARGVTFSPRCGRHRS